MPMHDWERVEAGIYHDFHHEWISDIKGALNRGILPPNHYALAEQVAAGFGPDVLTLQGDPESHEPDSGGGMATFTQVRPKLTPTAKKIGGISPRRMSQIAIRDVTGDARSSTRPVNCSNTEFI